MLHQAPKDMAAVKAVATIPRGPLKRAAALMRKTVERRTTIPILSYLKVDISQGKVTLTGTDLDVEISLDLEAETEGSASLMIAERVFAGFAPCASGPVTIRVTTPPAKGDKPQMDRVQISDGETTLTLNDHMPADEYPHFRRGADAEAKPAFTLSQGEVSRLFKLGRHCISTEETRYYLNGTFLTTNPDAGTVRAVTTNGHKLACIDTEEPADFSALGKDVDKGLIVPTKVVDLLLDIVSKGGNEPIEFGCAKDFLTAQVSGTRLRAKAIDGTYPDYTRVIPAPSKKLVAHLSGSALSRMSHAAKMIECQFRTPVKLDFDAGRIGFGSHRVQEDAVFEMPLQCKREDGCAISAIGFNLEYLRQQGSVTPTFTLSTNSEGAPARIHSDDPNALWVVMPMRL